MLEMYKSDLPSPHTLDKIIEYGRRLRKKKSEVTKPDSLQPALEVKHHFEVHLIWMIKIMLFIELMAMIFVYLSFPQACDPNIFPNCLLQIACTMPVTSAKQTVLSSLSKDINFTYHDNRKTVRLGSDEHLLGKAC